MCHDFRFPFTGIVSVFTLPTFYQFPSPKFSNLVFYTFLWLSDVFFSPPVRILFQLIYKIFQNYASQNDIRFVSRHDFVVCMFVRLQPSLECVCTAIFRTFHPFQNHDKCIPVKIILHLFKNL